MDVSSAKTSSLPWCRISPGKGATAALGGGTALGSNGTNLGFPTGDGRSAFQAAISQVPEGWDMNYRCRWSHFTSLINLPKNVNKTNF